MKYIPGKTYDLAHLRQPPENWEELVAAGHPLATAEGKAIRHLRTMLKSDWFTVYEYDIWMDKRGEWKSSNTGIVNVGGLLDHVRAILRLAPIAVKDGKPLHIGDEIELMETWVRWSPPIKLDIRYNPMHEILAGAEWRWPVEEKS